MYPDRRCQGAPQKIGKFLTDPVKFMASAAQNNPSAVSIIYVFNRSRLGFK